MAGLLLNREIFYKIREAITLGEKLFYKARKSGTYFKRNLFFKEILKKRGYTILGDSYFDNKVFNNLSLFRRRAHKKKEDV